MSDDEWHSPEDDGDIDLTGADADAAKTALANKVREIRLLLRDYKKQFVLLHWDRQHADAERQHLAPGQQQLIFCGFEPDSKKATRLKQRGGSAKVVYLTLRTPPPGAGGFRDGLLDFILSDLRVDIWGPEGKDGCCINEGCNGSLDSDGWREKEVISAMEIFLLVYRRFKCRDCSEFLHTKSAIHMKNL